jgi:ABC-2 type transport system ATP-binding protein
MNSAIRLTNVKKTYTGKQAGVSIRRVKKEAPTTTHAVKGISFDIAEGDFFGFLGPNGAGKSTTIHMITGLADITSGTIEVFGRNVVTDYRDTRKMIGLASQEPNFDPFFSLHESLVLQAGYHGMARSQAKDRADKLLKQFGLWEHRKKTSRQISGGMKRRLLIAKALVHDPKVLILDEPTAGVDVELRRDLWKLLRELNDAGTTIVLTTHYIEEAEALCDRIGIINQGEMIAIDDKTTLMNQLEEKRAGVKLAQMPETVGKMDQHDDVSIEGDSVFFPSEKANDYLPLVVQAAAEAQVAIVDIDTQAYDLEDIFVQLTNTK